MLLNSVVYQFLSEQIRIYIFFCITSSCMDKIVIRRFNNEEMNPEITWPPLKEISSVINPIASLTTKWRFINVVNSIFTSICGQLSPASWGFYSLGGFLFFKAWNIFRSVVLKQQSVYTFSSLPKRFQCDRRQNLQFLFCANTVKFICIWHLSSLTIVWRLINILLTENE